MPLLFFDRIFPQQFWFGGSLSLCSHLSGCSLAYFLSPCYHFCFMSLKVPINFFIYSVLLFCGFLSPPPPWGALVFSLWISSSSCPSLDVLLSSTLLTPETWFSSWPYSYILHMFSCLMSCGVSCNRNKSPSPSNFCRDSVAVFAKLPITSAEFFGVPKLEVPFSQNLFLFLVGYFLLL